MMSPGKSRSGRKEGFKSFPEYPLPPSCSVSNLSEFLADGNASFLRAARSGNVEKIIEILKGNIDINTSNANGLNALHLAAKEGHVDVVTELIKRGANVNAATKKGNTALHIASLAGQEEVVKVLIQLGANVNVQSQNGFTPLYMAAQENHDGVVSFLLASGANQSLATEDGFTPLAVALQQGHDKVVAVLLENDTKGKVRLPALHIAAKKDDCKAATLLLQSDHNPDVTSKSGFTPLHIAAHYGNENIAKILLSKGADVNYAAKHQITPLHVASKWGKTNMVVLLLEKGANIEAATRDGLTPLHCAARSGHDQVVDLLLEKGAPFLAKTKNGLAPLHMASQGDHVDSARILLYHKAPVDDVTVDYLTALHVAAHCGHVKVAKLLLDRKADPNARALNGFTPLHIACKKNRIKVVELLLKHGASIEATTESGLTPLHVASFMGCMNIVIYLIQNGANPDVPTVRGETPLHLAARANQTDIIRILLRNGASVDARAREEQTPLHIAARLGNVDIVSLLLQHGAAVDAVTKDMYTALHITAKEDQEEVAAALLDHGASLTTTTKKGFTPLHLAAKYGNIKVARLLLQKGAPVDAQGKNGVTPLHVAAHYNHVNVALLLLDKGASPHAMAKNGYTPLHIVAKKNQMDIASTLLEYGANTNSESKAGFTPLHLAAQEGHADMSSLLIDHKANVNQKANNGLTPLHLCAQEDRVNVAQVLVKNGAETCPQTKAGYTPLHVASHFGQINMVRYLLQNDANVHTVTSHGYTPLHQAAQQGHTLVVNLLLENQASPNVTTVQGQTPLSIAQRLGYISVVETLKVVTETTVTTTTTTVTEEKYKVVAPETMQETFMTDSEDEGGEEAMLGDQSYRYLTADEMKSLGDDSLPIDVTKDEKQQDAIQSVKQFGAPMVEEDNLSPQHITPVESGFSEKFSPDNVDLAKAPVHAGRFSVDDAFYYFPPKGMLRSRFLVSFMVDARGGAMRGCRHSGVRVIIPPRKASMPMRITCRYLRKEKLIHPPPLMEGEACASRILEMGPVGARFLGPVIIEVPHFASTRGKEREITILRSDTGETWREHTLEASEEAVQEVLNESFEGEELSALEDLNTNRITRILTTDFPQYFAIVTRIRQEVHGVGPEGGMVSSTVVPQVQAIFPEGALTKKIRVGLQAQPIAPELVAKLLGNRVAVSPIVTVEPRRRKFHKPITLTIPVPQAATKGMINQYSGNAPTLRLLCSITGSTKSGGSSKAQWEDVTGSTPLTFVNDCVSFTTTVSARFWLMDCHQVNEVTRFATELYQEAVYVPFMSKFVIFAKRHDPFEAQLRVFCMTDDKEDKTLEHQEHFTEVAKSRDVEVLEGKLQYLEFAGNLVPVTKSGEQLKLDFQAFHENRLPFIIRVKDPHVESMGRIAFMKEPKAGRGEAPQTPICNLNVALPEVIVTEGSADVLELVTLEKCYDFVQEAGLSKPELIHRADLRLSDIARELDKDWVLLAQQLDIPEQDTEQIKAQTMCDQSEQARMMLRLWLQKSGPKATGNELEKGLRKINREDIIKNCMFNVELVTDDVEKAVAKVHLDQSGFDVFKEELGSSREASMRRGASLDVSYDEQDIMKEAESAAETSSETGSIFERDQLSHVLTDDKDVRAALAVHETVLSDTDSPLNSKQPISDYSNSNENSKKVSELKYGCFEKESDINRNAKNETFAGENTPFIISQSGRKLHKFWPSDEIVQKPVTETTDISLDSGLSESYFDKNLAIPEETNMNDLDTNKFINGGFTNMSINSVINQSELFKGNSINDLLPRTYEEYKCKISYESSDSNKMPIISVNSGNIEISSLVNIEEVEMDSEDIDKVVEYDAVLEPDTKLPVQTSNSKYSKEKNNREGNLKGMLIEDITSSNGFTPKLENEMSNLTDIHLPTESNIVVSDNNFCNLILASTADSPKSPDTGVLNYYNIQQNQDNVINLESILPSTDYCVSLQHGPVEASDLGYFSLDKDPNSSNISAVTDKSKQVDLAFISEKSFDQKMVHENIPVCMIPETHKKADDVLSSDNDVLKENSMSKVIWDSQNGDCGSYKMNTNAYDIKEAGDLHTLIDAEKDIFECCGQKLEKPDFSSIIESNFTLNSYNAESSESLERNKKLENEKLEDSKMRRASKTPPPSPIDETVDKGGIDIEKLTESTLAAALLPAAKEAEMKKTVEIVEIRSTEATVGDSVMPSVLQEIPAKLTESETWPSGDLDTSQVSVSSLPDDEKSETTTATVSSTPAAITIDVTKKAVPDTEPDEDLEEETLSPTKFKEDLCSKKASPTKSIFESKIFLSPKIPVQLTPEKILCLQELPLSPVKEVSEIETKETCTSPCSDKLETVKPNQLISTRKGFRTRKRLSPIHDGSKIEQKMPSRVDRGLSPIAVLTAGPSGIEKEGSEYFVQTYDAPAMQEPTPTTSDAYISKGTEMSPKSIFETKEVSKISFTEKVDENVDSNLNKLIEEKQTDILQTHTSKFIISTVEMSRGIILSTTPSDIQREMDISVKVEKSTSPFSNMMLDTGIGTDSPVTADTASSPFLPETVSPSSLSIHSSAQLLLENSSTQTIHVEMLSAHTSPIDGPFSLQESNVSCCGTDCSLKSDSLDDISRTLGTPSSDNVEIDVELNYPLPQSQSKDLPISTVREFLEEHTVSDNASDAIETEDISTPSSHDVSSRTDFPGSIEDNEAVNKMLVIESFRNVFATEAPFSVMASQQIASPKRHIEYKKRRSLILSEASSEDKIFSLHDQLLSEESALESSTDSGVDLKESTQNVTVHASVVQTSLHSDKQKLIRDSIKEPYEADIALESAMNENILSPKQLYNVEQILPVSGDVISKDTKDKIIEEICLKEGTYFDVECMQFAEGSSVKSIASTRKEIVVPEFQVKDIPGYIKRVEKEILDAASCDMSISTVKEISTLHIQQIFKTASMSDCTPEYHMPVNEISDSKPVEEKPVVPVKASISFDKDDMLKLEKSSPDKDNSEKVLDYLQKVESEICLDSYMHDLVSPAKEGDVVYMQEVFEPNIYQGETIWPTKLSDEYKDAKVVKEKVIVPVKASLSFEKEINLKDEKSSSDKDDSEKILDKLEEVESEIFSDSVTCDLISPAKDVDVVYMQEIFEADVCNEETPCVSPKFSDGYKNNKIVEEETILPVTASLSFDKEIPSTCDNIDYSVKDDQSKEYKIMPNYIQEVEEEILSSQAIKTSISPVTEIDTLYIQEVLESDIFTEQSTPVSPKLTDDYKNVKPVDEKPIIPVKTSLSFDKDTAHSDKSDVSTKNNLTLEKYGNISDYILEVEDEMLSARATQVAVSPVTEDNTFCVQEILKHTVSGNILSPFIFKEIDMGSAPVQEKTIVSVKTSLSYDSDDIPPQEVSSLTETVHKFTSESGREEDSAAYISDKETFSDVVDRIFSNVDIDNDISKQKLSENSNVFVAEATVIKDKRDSFYFSDPQKPSPKLEQSTSADTTVQEITEVDQSGATTHIIQKTTHMTLITQVKSDDGDLRGTTPVDSKIEEGSSPHSPELSFAEKRDFFQKFSLSSSSPSGTPTHTSKTNLETEIKLLPDISDTVVSVEGSPEDQLSFVERVKFFENATDTQVQIIETVLPEIREIKKEVWTVSENEQSEPQSSVYSDEVLEKECEIEIIEDISHIVLTREEEVSSPLYSGKEVLETPFDTNKDAKVEVMVKKLSPGSEMIEICSVENIEKTELGMTEAADAKDKTEAEDEKGIVFETCKVHVTAEDIKLQAVEEVDDSMPSVTTLPESGIKTDQEFINETFRSITESSYEISKSTIDAFKKGGNDKPENKWQRESPDNISIVKETMEPSLGKSEIFICTEETLDNVKKILSVADAESNVVVPEGEASASEEPHKERDLNYMKDIFICSEETAQDVQKIISTVDAESSEILEETVICEKDEVLQEEVNKKDIFICSDETAQDVQKIISIVDTESSKILKDEERIIEKFEVISPIGTSDDIVEEFIEFDFKAEKQQITESEDKAENIHETKHATLKSDIEIMHLELSRHPLEEVAAKQKIGTTNIEDLKKHDVEEEVLPHTGNDGDKSESSLSSVKDRSIEIEFLPVLEVSDDVKVTVDKTGHDALGTPCSFHKEMSIESQHSELEQSFENRQSNSSGKSSGKKIPLTPLGGVEKAEYEEVEKSKKGDLEYIYRESISHEKSGKETVHCVEVTQFTKHSTEVYNVPSEKLREKFSSKKIHIETLDEEKEYKTLIPQKLNQFLDSVTQLEDLTLPSDIAPVHKRTEEWLDQSGELLKEGSLLEGADNGLFEDRPPTLDDEPHRRSSPTAESFDDKARVEQCDTDVMMQLLDFVSRNDIELAEVRTEDEAPDIEEDISPSGEEEICSKITFEEHKLDSKDIIHEVIEEKSEEHLKVAENDNILHSPLRSSFDSVTSPSKRELSLDNVETVVEAKHVMVHEFKSEHVSQMHPQSSLEVEVGSHDSDELGYNYNDIEKEIVPLSFVEEEDSVRPESKLRFAEDAISRLGDIEQHKGTTSASVVIDSVKKQEPEISEDNAKQTIQEKAMGESDQNVKPVEILESAEPYATESKRLKEKLTEHVQQLPSETLLKETAVADVEDSLKISKEESDLIADTELVDKTDSGFIPCAFVNTAFAGAELIDEVEQVTPIRARSPYEVVRGEDDQALEEVKDSVSSVENISYITRHVEVRHRPMLQSIPSEISEEDLVEREITSPFSKEEFEVPEVTESADKSGQEFVTESSVVTTDSKIVPSGVEVITTTITRKIISTVGYDGTIPSDAELQRLTDENEPSNEVKYISETWESVPKTDDVTTPESDTGIPTSPFELMSESELSEGEHKSTTFPSSHSLPKSDKDEKSQDSVIMTTQSQSVTEKTISVSMATSSKDARDSCTLNKPKETEDGEIVSQVVVHSEIATSDKSLANGPGEVEYNAEYDYYDEGGRAEIMDKKYMFETISYPERLASEAQEVEGGQKRHYSNISDDVIDSEIREILDSDHQSSEDIIERPVTPEPPKDDMSVPNFASRNLNRLSSGAIEDLTSVDEFAYRNDIADTPNTPDSKSGFAYGMHFEKYVLDQTEEAMDIDSDQYSEEKEPSYGYGMRFERDPDLEDEDIPCYGDLYTHEEEDEDALENGDKAKAIAKSIKDSDFDILAGRKYFTKNVEMDEMSVSSLQEFEHLEAEIVSGRKSSVGSIDSLNGKQISKSGDNDDVSMSSLTEFERLERECTEGEKIDPAMQESITQLSEIEEGHESQASEASQENRSDAGREEEEEDDDASVIEEYNEQLDNIEDIILKSDTKESDLPFQLMMKQTHRIEKTGDDVEISSGEERVIDSKVSPKIRTVKTSIVTEVHKISGWTTSKSLSDAKDDLDQDSLRDESSLKPDSLIDDAKLDFQDSLLEERSDDADSLQGENIDEMRDSLFEERHIEDDSLHEMDILPDESSLSLESSFPAVASLDSSKADEPIKIKISDRKNSKDSPQEASFGTTFHLDGKTQINITDLPKGIDVMQSSTDSLEQSSSAAFAAFHVEGESLMSSSLNSAITSEDYTMISSTDTLEQEGRIMYRYEDIPVDDIEMLVRSGHRVIVDSEGNIQTHYDGKHYIEMDDVTNAALCLASKDGTEVKLPPTSAVQVHSALTTVKYVNGDQGQQKSFHSTSDQGTNGTSYESSHFDPDVEVEEIETTDEFGNKKIVRKIRKVTHTTTQFTSSSSSKDVEEKMKEFLREHTAGESAGTAEEEIEEERTLDEKGNVVVIRTVKQQIVSEPEVHSRTFTGANAEDLSKDYVETFKTLDPTEDIHEYEKVDEQGNVVRVTQQFVVTPQVHTVSFSGPDAHKQMEEYMKQFNLQSQNLGEFEGDQQRLILPALQTSRSSEHSHDPSDTSESIVHKVTGDTVVTKTVLSTFSTESSEKGVIPESSTSTSISLETETDKLRDTTDERTPAMPK